MSFDVLIPVKSLDRAKTRLLGLPRGVLMRAFALDTLAACAASSAVRTAYVVTDDDELAATAGCERLPDLGDGDLNLALHRAAELVPDPIGVAALLGDLPYLKAHDLTAALQAVPERGGVVADAAGTGSTLLATRLVHDFRPHFGVDSFQAHLDAGYAAITLPVPTLRQDVDTATDIHQAASAQMRPGRHTREALRTHVGR